MSDTGICENFFGSFECRCPAGWTGQTCGELINHCASQPCQNDGQCVNSVTGYICVCDGTGFHGNTCEINIDDCEGLLLLDRYLLVMKWDGGRAPQMRGNDHLFIPLIHLQTLCFGYSIELSRQDNSNENTGVTLSVCLSI